ncbi:allophanate hydrolase [Duganella hordei]|uniref:allophanate hydrolase n=1 Tax=Duganella hordei TaxID=2865934 RepID=UPI0030E895CD
MPHFDHSLDLRLDTLRAQYGGGTLCPTECIRRVLAAIAAERPEIWITRVPDDRLLTQAAALDRLLSQRGAAVFDSMPLFGVPFAVKDNIDVAGMATTAACPEFAYVPAVSATVVGKLLEAGAILVGKTNLDQFATGLVGTRSPYGVVRNALHPDYVSGGSSAGSAVAVALSLVSFALGTDTAGSGRVPAGLNNIVGLKPSRGLLSTRGVVPACRTLDCVSIFAATVGDAWTVTQAAAGYDEGEPYSRTLPMAGVKRRGYRITVPAQPEFYGNQAAQHAYEASLERLQQLPDCHLASIDFTPFREAALLLYQGPWVAERMAAVGDFFTDHRQAMNPVVAGIISQADRYSAVDAFNGQYRLAALRRQAERQLQGYDFMLVPTAPTMPTIAEVEAEPVLRNSELGYYTNFVNFFDMAALAIPAVGRADGLPFGVTLIGAAGSDHMLAAAAEGFVPLWQPANAPAIPVVGQPLPFAEASIQLAVVGAHLEGQPLNWQLLERGARKIESTRTSARYRLHALAGTTPPKPGLERVVEGGAAIAVELWELPLRNFGAVVAEVPAPLGIGSLELADGRWVKGFVCEPYALASARDITHFGGWRAYLEHGMENA